MRKRSVLLGVAAATMLMTAGCQSKYEKIEVPGAIVESAAEEQKAEISENKAELTTESAPAMEARDETVYVKATTLNLRVSPAPGAAVLAAPANGTALKRTERPAMRLQPI